MRDRDRRSLALSGLGRRGLLAALACGLLVLWSALGGSRGLGKTVAAGGAKLSRHEAGHYRRMPGQRGE